MRGITEFLGPSRITWHIELVVLTGFFSGNAGSLLESRAYQFKGL